ncbi:glycoside hydrolase family 2 TIM barrel-domain containing protein [Candidatus Haliotispira prima]|uniref:Glycoside hydrolase family 2 TIM barrel-domain containing protein n=1 Tax=Candidatus Haliotispira prima TaxID=3034016 RepID=A0ABY8MLV5_9SPIO|nr:glycoside hydrolase family 2 TIM barrel-domain containing protein [Candidatus Haliotispira prima]
MRHIKYLDFDWFYCPEFREAFLAESDCSDAELWQSVQLPHTNAELPGSYFDDRACRFVSAYRRNLWLPPGQDAQRVALLRFEGVMNYAEIYLNGIQIGCHKGGYTPFEVVLPDSAAHWGEDNRLLVRVDSGERSDTPPFGFVIDYLTYGGIYREVSLHICEALHFGVVKLSPAISEPQNIRGKDSLVSGWLRLEPEIANPFLLKGQQQLDLRILGPGVEFSQSYLIELQGGRDGGGPTETCILDSLELDGLRLWDIGQGNLYEVELRLGEMDRYSAKIGWRDCHFGPEGFRINGRNQKLIGLNRHQSYPYAGYAMPANAQQKDADLFPEYGCNILRTSHYPQHRQFIEYCDEIGLLVFTEIPGWQHIGESAEWQEQVLCDVRDMILRDYNSPSVVLWGVRINESPDHSDLYRKTNELARWLDPTRQTGGVRCHNNSELLEDVYTMNNFVLNGRIDEGGGKGRIALNSQQEITGLDHAVPYLVTESNGHMFPTKAWDTEERRTEHAVRHLRVIDAAHIARQHSGSISWCAFDYNTHHEFGAGDKICHHGVFDMYREPKFAAWAYRSQKDPAAAVVLEPLSCWARGERDECRMGPLWVLHNCDYIELYINGKLQNNGSQGHKIYPDRGLFRGLPHPPSIIRQIDSLWGEAFGGAEIKGYIGGTEVVARRLAGNPSADRLLLRADQTWLRAARPEATRICLRVTDQFGNSLPFLMAGVHLRLTGPKVQAYADEVSPLSDGSGGWELFSTLRGGSSAIWLLSAGEAGTAELEARVIGYPKLTARLQIQINLESVGA